MSKMTKTVAALGVVAGLGVAMLPVGAFAANSGTPVSDGPNASTDGGTTPASANIDVQFQALVEDTIEISAVDNLVDGGTATSSTNASGSTTVTIKTNNEAGYDATIAASTDTTGVTAAGATAADMKLADGTAVIPGGNAPVAGTSNWGYKIGDITNVMGATTNATSFANETAASADAGDEYTLGFEASVSSAQKSGTYTGKVTLTATAKANTAP